MKVLLALFLIPLVIIPASAQMLSDRTGLKTVFDVTVDGKMHQVEVVGNFDAMDMTYMNGNLTLDIFSSLPNNIGEMQIPHEITGGDARYYLDGEEVSPKVLKNRLISFVTLEFEGNGTHTIVVQGVQPQPETPTVVEAGESNMEDSLSVIIAVIMGAAAAGGIAAYRKRKSTASSKSS